MEVQPNIFENIPRKREYKETTTIKFKNDIIEFFDTMHKEQIEELVNPAIAEATE